MESSLCQGSLHLPLSFYINYRKIVPNNIPIEGLARKCFRTFDESYIANNDNYSFLIHKVTAKLIQLGYISKQIVRAHRLLDFWFWSGYYKCIKE